MTGRVDIPWSIFEKVEIRSTFSPFITFLNMFFLQSRRIIFKFDFRGDIVNRFLFFLYPSRKYNHQNSAVLLELIFMK